MEAREDELRRSSGGRCVFVLSVAWRHLRLTAHGLKCLAWFWFRTAAVILIAAAVYDITHTPRWPLALSEERTERTRVIGRGRKMEKLCPLQHPNDSQRPFSESQQVLKAAHSSSTCRHTQLMNKLQLQLRLPSNLPWKLELSLALFLSLVLLAVTVGCSPLPLPLRRKTKPAAMHFLPNARIRIPYTFATASTMLCSAQFA